MPTETMNETSSNPLVWLLGKQVFILTSWWTRATVICQLNKKSKLRLAQEKHNLRGAYSKDKLEFQCFFLALEQLHIPCIRPSATPFKLRQLVDMLHLWVECTMYTIQCLEFFLHWLPCEIHSSLHLESGSLPTTNQAFLWGWSRKWTIIWQTTV